MIDHVRTPVCKTLFRYMMELALAGTELLGSQSQGLVTQQVTRTLNWVGVAVAIVLLFELRKTGTRGT